MNYVTRRPSARNRVAVGELTSNVNTSCEASASKLEPSCIRRALRDPVRVAVLLDLSEGARTQSGGVMVRCPAHDDATASCSLRTGRDGTLYFHCFGCPAAGDVLTLIALASGLDVRADFPRVLRRAAQMIDQSDQYDGGLAFDEASSSPPSCTDVEFERIVEAILAACPIASNAVAQAYLEHRRVLEQAQRAGWGALPSDEIGQRDIIEVIIDLVGAEAWMGSGLARPSLGFLWSGHVLVIPWVDERGHVVALQRRLIDRPAEGTPPYIFSTGRRARGPYGIDWLVNVSAGAPVAFVEGAMDVLSMRTLCAKRAINRAIVGLPGVSAWKPEWARVATGRDALVCVDADPAGDRIVATMAADLRAAGATSIVRMKPLTGKDWNDALMTEAP